MKRLHAVSVIAFLVAAALVCVVLAPTPASAQRFGRNKIQYHDYKWSVLSTPHFDIHYYEGAEAFAVRAALVMEDGYEQYSYKLREVLPWKVPVILYSSHADFLETNVLPEQLSEGVQAFAEPSRRRIVLPFTSSFKEFEHTAIHELAHVFTFHIVYNRMLDNVFTRNYLFAMPLWVAEGLAEYLAEGWDADADMFVRDAVIHDYLYPFYALSGFYVYKEGQSVFNYIAETYGHEKVLELLDALAGTRNAQAALGRTIGLTEEELYEKWSKALRKHYWPLYPDKQDIADIGRQLTDHIKDRGYYNTKPILSPDGEFIVFFSDRSGLIEIFVMSALDGKIVARVVTGSRSNRYESLHLLTSSICFDPTGDRVAFVAKNKGHDALFVKNIKTGDETRYEIDTSGLTAPAWNPVKDQIVLSATYHGQIDLLLVDLEAGTTKRLTNDLQDQLTPRFFPDGKRVAFVHYPDVTIPVPSDFSGENRKRLSEIDFLANGNVRHGETYDIWEYNLETGAQRSLVATPGDDTDPIVLADGNTIIYASDESGVNNLHAATINNGENWRFTDVLGGLFSPSVHEEKGRIAFSAFVKGGWDVFVSDDLNTMLTRRYAQPTRRILAHDPGVATRDLAAADVAKAEADSTKLVTNKVPSTVVVGPADSSITVSVVDPSPVVGIDSTATESDSSTTTTPAPVTDPAAIDLSQFEPKVRPIEADKPTTTPRSRPETLSDPVGVNAESLFRGATVSPYKTRLSPDFIGSGGGLYFSTGFGFGIANSIALSDMLGDQHLTFAFNLYQDIAQSDVLLAYTNLRRRADFAFGAYQFSSYFDSRVTSVGEGFSGYRLFSERNYGIFGLMSLPFNKFYRMETDIQAYYSDREFYERTNPNSGFSYRTVGSDKVRLIEPSIAFVHDSALYGMFGPVEGSRWRISLAQGVATNDRDISRTTGYLDWRWYKTIFWRNSLALRFTGAASNGEDPRYFFLGGPTSLRGYDYQQFDGTRMWMTSVEYRFPLFDAIIFGWPGRWGFTNIGGTAFFDMGSAFYGDFPSFFDDSVSGWRLDDQIYADAGFGVYMYLGYFLMNFQFAWPTNLERFDNEMQFHFYMGPTF